MGEISSLKISIGASVDDFMSKLGGVKDALGGLGTFAESAIGLLSNPIALATAAIAGIGTAAFSAAQNLDEAFDTIRVGTGATGADLEALKEDFRGVFGTVPDDAATVGSAIADLNTRLGLTGAPLQEMSRQFLDLARVTGGDVQSQIASVTRVFGDWSVATEDQSGAMDFLFKTSQTTGIGVDQLANTIVQFGAPLRQLGFDFETSAVLIGKWEKEGVNVETVLAGMKMGLANFAEAGIPAEQGLKSVIAQITALGPGAEATGLAMEIFGKRSGPDMAAAILEGRFELDEILATIQNSPETIGAAADNVKDFGERFSELSNQVTLLLEPLGMLLMDALTAVASFLAENFNPAMEVLSGLWEGLLGFIKPVTDYLSSTVLPALKTVFEVWLGLQLMIADLFIPVIQAVWDALQPLISFVAGQVVQGFQAFATAIETVMGWLKQIPGVSDLVAAAQARVEKAFKDNTVETKKAEKAHVDLADTIKKKVTPATIDLAKAMDGGKEEKKKAEAAAKRLKEEFARLEKQERENEKAVKAVEKAEREFEKSTIDLAKAMDKETAAARATSDGLTLVLGVTNALADPIDGVTRRSFEAQEALRNLGIKPRVDLEGLANVAEMNFNKVKDAGIFSATEIDAAWIAMLNARKAALEAQGQTLPPAEQKTFEALLQKQKDFKEASTGSDGIFTQWAKDAKGITDLLATDMIKGLFSGDMSFGEGFKAHLTTLKDSFVNTLTKPMMDALTGPNGFVTKGLKAVTDALDGVIKKLTGQDGVEGAIKRVFGSPEAPTPTPGAPTPGSPAPSGGGGSGGGGAMGAVNMITGIATAVSSIIGNFQMAGMNKSLDIIVRHTLQTVNLLGGENQDSGVTGKLADITRELMWGTATKKVEDLSNMFRLDFMPATVRLSTQNIESNTFWMLGQAKDINLHTANIEALLRTQTGMPAPVVEVSLDGEQLEAAITVRQEQRFARQR